MATHIHPDRQTHTHTHRQLIASGNNTVPVLLIINADGVETRLVNPRVIKPRG